MSEITLIINTSGPLLTISQVGVQGPAGSGGGGASDGDKGDIIVSGSGSVWTIDNGAVSESKLNSTVNASLDLADSAVQPAALSSGLAGKANTSHTHIASSITDFDTEVSNNTDVAANTTARHSHSNKALLDTYTQTEVNLSDAVSKKHAHSNQAVLDATTASFLIADETKLDGIEAGAEVNNISDVNATDLTDGGNTTLHIHDSRYYTEAEIDSALAGKQATLVSATNIKTINGTSILGSGDLVVSGGGSVSDAAYGVGWNGDTTTAPSRNAVYDKFESLQRKFDGGSPADLNLTTSVSVFNGGSPADL